MIKGVGHAAIIVSDLEKSLAFYRDILGFKLVRSFDRQDGAKVVDLSMDPRQLGEIQLLKYPEAKTASAQKGEPALGLHHIGLLVEDMDATYAELRSKGVEFLGEPHLVYSFTPSPTAETPKAVRLLDPDGVLVELITFIPRGPA